MPCNNANYLIHERICTFTDRVFISPSVPTDNFDLPMENWFTIGTDRTDGQGFLGATLCPCNNANYLIHERILHIYRSCIDFSIRTDGQLRFTDGELVYHRYRPYRWTRFFGGLPYALAIMLTTSFTKGFCTFTDRVFISPSVPTDNFDLPMENWFTIGTDRTDGQGFWGLPYALAMLLTTSFTKGFCTFTIVYSFLHPYRRTTSIYRWRIGLPSVRPYRWTRFWGLPYALAIMLTTSFTKGFCTFTDRVFISPSVPTDNFDLPMENWFTIGTDRTDGQGFWGLPYGLAIMLSTSFTKGFCTVTDRVFISTCVPTDNFDLPMKNWFSIGTDRTDGQGFWGLPYALAIMLTTSFTKGFCTFTDRVFISPSVPTDNFRFTDGELVYHRYRPYRWTRFLGATLCPCNNANYLIHERILHIYRSCIHFSIRTDGQLRFTDGELVYHRYRPYRWTRFLGLPDALAIMLTTSFTKGFCTFTDRVFISPSVQRTTSIYRWRIGLPSVSTVPMDKVLGLLYALAIMLITSFTKGF